MQNVQDTTPEAKKDKPVEKHTGSKLAFAAAFATVGAKISTIGTAIDAADLLRDEPTFKEKMKLLFSRKIVAKLEERKIEHIPEEYKRFGQVIKKPPVGVELNAMFKTVKWTMITGIVGTVAGAAIGWVRGEKAGSAKNIVKHPIKAVKAVFGFSEPLDDNAQPITQASAQEAPATAKAAQAQDAPADEKSSPNWQARMAKNATQQAETSRSM